MAKSGRNRPIIIPKHRLCPKFLPKFFLCSKPKNSWKYYKNLTPPPPKRAIFWGGGVNLSNVVFASFDAACKTKGRRQKMNHRTKDQMCNFFLSHKVFKKKKQLHFWKIEITQWIFLSRLSDYFTNLTNIFGSNFATSSNTCNSKF